MSEEPVFSDRFIPVLALPGVLLNCADVALDMLDGKPAPSILLWLLFTLLFGLVSVVVLTIPLHFIAKFQILRSKGLTRAKTVGVMVFGLCLFIVGGLIYQGAGKLFGWLFEGSRFYLIAGVAFVLFLLIYIPYSLYRERKVRNKLNVIDITPSRRTENVEK
jgi:hypothetical protein